MPVAATALGATVIEKHFTLDKSLPGPDHQASLAPSELIDMVRSIREVESAMGESRKYPALSERPNRLVARKSLVTSKAVRIGELFSESNIEVKRPANGVSPLRYWDYLGRVAQRDYEADELL